MDFFKYSFKKYICKLLAIHLPLPNTVVCQYTHKTRLSFFTKKDVCVGRECSMVHGNFPVPERPTNLDYSMARAYCAISRCGSGLFGHFFSCL